MPNSSCSPHGRTLRLTAILLVAVSICLVAEAAEDPLALLARLDKQETQELLEAPQYGQQELCRRQQSQGEVDRS